MPNKLWIWHHFFQCGLCPKLVLVYIWFSLMYTPIDSAGWQIKNNAICKSILKTISKLRDQTSLSWKLTSVHSKDGHSTEITRQSKIKEPLLINGKLKSLVQSLKNFWFLQKLESRQKFPAVCLFVYFVSMDAFLKEGSGYPIGDFALRLGTEQTFLLT